MRKRSMKDKVSGLINKFNHLDFHDDGLISVTVHAPGDGGANSAKIEIEFQDDSTGARKLLSFAGCGNLRYIMDFDVLKDNRFAQTKKANSANKISDLKRFVRSQTPHWHVKYMPPSPKDNPIKKKLSRIGD